MIAILVFAERGKCMKTIWKFLFLAQCIMYLNGADKYYQLILDLQNSNVTDPIKVASPIEVNIKNNMGIKYNAVYKIVLNIIYICFWYDLFL